MAPNGMITFLSKAYGGRASDAHITVNSGFLDLLSPGDEILADKGFPEITTNGAVAVRPPKKQKDKQLTVEQMKTTKEIGSVRVLVERVIGKLKQFRLLKDDLEVHFLPHINEILHICAVLVNLSSPVLKQEPEETEDAEKRDHTYAVSDGSETESASEGEEEEEEEEEEVQVDGHFVIDELFFDQVVN